ncbi:hypothetical protein GBA52_024560 [Prunus armeniaca]|nr:hypothetical protein GBA52_024560 [Prunus armeniaca]
MGQCQGQGMPKPRHAKTRQGMPRPRHAKAKARHANARQDMLRPGACQGQSLTSQMARKSKATSQGKAKAKHASF